MRLTRSLFRLILLILVLIILALAILKPEPAGQDCRMPIRFDRRLWDRSTGYVVEKSARQLTVFRGGQPLRSYKVALGVLSRWETNSGKVTARRQRASSASTT
jgi:hypothetical protein